MWHKFTENCKEEKFEKNLKIRIRVYLQKNENIQKIKNQTL